MDRYPSLVPFRHEVTFIITGVANFRLNVRTEIESLFMNSVVLQFLFMFSIISPLDICKYFFTWFTDHSFVCNRRSIRSVVWYRKCTNQHDLCVVINNFRNLHWKARLWSCTVCTFPILWHLQLTVLVKRPSNWLDHELLSNFFLNES